MVAARLERPLKQKPGFYRAIRGSLNLEMEPPRFVPAEPKGASVFAVVKDCFGYVILEPHVVEVPVGSVLEVRLNEYPLLASALFRETGVRWASKPE
jgi:molybdopterin biosynthesis enzyme